MTPDDALEAARQNHVPVLCAEVIEALDPQAGFRDSALYDPAVPHLLRPKARSDP